MQFDHLNFNEDDGLMSIEDLRALRLRKKKIESDKKARKYILDINQRYRKMNTSKSKDRKSTRLNSSHRCISYAVFCLKKKVRLLMLHLKKKLNFLN